MGLRMPESMDECLYFTNRTLGEKGKVIAWAYKIECPKCKKAKMGKPVEKGKIKIRATEYKCPACGYTEQKEEHEERLTVQAQYTCPECGHEGEAEMPYKRKSWQGVKAFVFQCESCNAKLGISKKLAQPKKKKG
jgi:predicted RNA-binding Zn-ribbon protein involved in translation (DUF1610 family)